MKITHVWICLDLIEPVGEILAGKCYITHGDDRPPNGRWIRMKVDDPEHKSINVRSASEEEDTISIQGETFFKKLTEL